MIVLLDDGQAVYVAAGHVGETVKARLLDDDGMPSNDSVEGLIVEVLNGDD